MEDRNSYHGPERRFHKIYVTENTEYHVRRDVCVAVKPRTPRAGWVENRALRMRLQGSIQPGSMLPMPGMPEVGFRMFFEDADRNIITSPVVAILRPAREVVAQYPPES
jgi:hypothetical protein